MQTTPLLTVKDKKRSSQRENYIPTGPPTPSPSQWCGIATRLLRQQDGELSWKNIWDVSTFSSQRRIELEPSHTGRWSCYWTLPRLEMRIKDRSRLSAKKGWKGTKSQCVQITRSIIQPKTASLHSCAMVSYTFLPLVQALTPRDQVNPDETWWGSRAALQLHHTG